MQTKTVNILGRSREIEDLEEKLNKLNSKLKNKEKEKEEYLDSIEELLRDNRTLRK